MTDEMPSQTLPAQWVLLRGLTRESRHWGEFPRLLEERLPGACVLCPDLPGTGALNSLNRTRSPLHIAGMLDSVRQQVPLHDGADRIVVGLSMGGMVAAEWAHRYPAELAGCVLINASLRALSPLAHRLQWQGMIQLARLASRWRDAPLCEHAIWKLTSNRPCDPRTMQAWIRIREHAGMSPVNVVLQLVAAARYQGSRTAPSVPALVLTSHADRLVSWRCSQRIAETWDVPLHMHPWAGHDLPLDDGAWVADALLAWWQSSGG